jgi:non-heme chloroperoxidase
MNRRAAWLVASCLSLGACQHPAATDPTGPMADPALPRSIRVDGVELHYVEQGNGPPLVLVHGSLADYSYWQRSRQIDLLSGSHRVIAYSRRYNYPNTNPTADLHSPMIEAGDLGAIIDRVAGEPVHLVGHSYGAYTALVHAMDHPGSVRSLVLAEPPIIAWLPQIPGGEGILESFMEGVWTPLGRAFAEGGDAAGLDFTARWYFGVPWEEVAPEWQQSFRRNVAEWRALAGSPATFPDLDEARIRRLEPPVLLISAGRNAGGFNDLIDGHLDRLLPTSRRLVIADASHEMFLDDSEGSAAAILQFVSEH